MEAIKSDQLQEKLDAMVGKLWMYQGREVRIKGFNIGSGQVRVINNGHPILLPIDRLEECLDNFLPVQDEADGGNKTAAVEVFQHDAKQINKLEDVIMQNIEKVQEDPEYLPQAKAVTNNVNTLLNMNKQKIAMIKELRKHKENGY